MVVQRDVPRQRLRHVFSAVETVDFQHIGNAPVEVRDYAVGFRRSGLGRVVLNVQGLAEPRRCIFAMSQGNLDLENSSDTSPISPKLTNERLACRIPGPCSRIIFFLPVLVDHFGCDQCC